MDKLYIKSIIQRILDKEFKSKDRRKIIEYDNRFNICCPICGDGKSDHKKRGNLYFDKLRYICFNESGCNCSFDNFCKKFNEQIDPDKKLEMIAHLDSVMTYSDYESDFIDAKFENLIDLSELERVFNSNLSNISDFKPIQPNGGVYKYLIGRGLPPEFHKNIYQAKHWKNDDESEWVIVMLNRKGSKVIGMQTRNLKEGKRRNFKIYNYENLLEWINIGRDPIDMDMNELVIYNKLSYYFNILNVDFTKMVTIFEGYLDSMFYPNSIGMVGVNTDARMIENSGIDIQYFFDNDEAGFKKSEEKIKSGYSVFLWNKLFEDIVNKKKSDDPQGLLYRISKIKDVNKLSQVAPNPYKKLKLYNYFSVDVLDLKWIPKYKKKKKREEVDYNRKFEELKNY